MDWYVETTTRLILYVLCNGANVRTNWIVEQLGLAISLSFLVNSDAFISGTINFTPGFIRHAEELSITTVPIAVNFGAHLIEVSPPAEKRAISGDIFSASSKVTTVMFFPSNAICFPADRSDATGINSVKGNFRSAKTFNITSPTIPVAPTTAIFIINYLIRQK